jgi:hypothetical protein
LFEKRKEPGKKILEIGIQPLFVFLALIGQKKEPEGFQTPNENVQPFQHIKPVDNRPNEGFMVHPAPAKQKIPQLFTRMTDEWPIPSLLKYLYQLEQINEPADHKGSEFVKIKKEKDESSLKIR